MSQVLQIKKRLKGIQSIHKVTKAMETMAITGLRRIQKQEQTLQEYFKVFEELRTWLPLPTAQTQGQAYLVFLSTRGFCGNFNNNLITYFQKNYQPQKQDSIILLGSIAGRFKHKWPNALTKNYSDLPALCQDLFQKNFAVKAVYNQYKTILKQDPAITALYPIESSGTQNHIYHEPDLNILQNKFSQDYVQAKLEKIRIESLLGEYCNRFQSMKSANDNAQILIEDLKIHLNKTRQSVITAELSEVVSAFEVLRGK